MKLVYISSPLCGEIDKNRERAHDYCDYAVQCGVIPLAPHTIFTRYLDDQRPEERQLGQAMEQELLKRSDELWIMGDIRSPRMSDMILAARAENITILYVSDALVESNYKIRHENEPLSYEDCIPDSNQMNYENQILVLKPEVYGKSAKVTADDSLWLAKIGFGCTYGARGQAVFAENLLSGRNVRWERSDFYGIVEPSRLYDWISDKPIYNERAFEIICDAEAAITDIEEMEAEAEP